MHPLRPGLPFVARSAKNGGPVAAEQMASWETATTHRYLDHLHPEVVIATMKEEQGK